ncbi:MAG: DoxX family protein [Bacteroidetes bacterium]|nr:DoxX family protein [Bacteroidota bacterium]MBK6819310.1 DoxX family protein [Bacteroidota bacterium]MBK7041591.1 DoxX family protein [Bacteroidota bacterium]MBK7589521.1 DoxX family protein [Bacteroidota bacterium]MBK9301222.1 DoxX family protein [Bacteroidota bacterium]
MKKNKIIFWLTTIIIALMEGVMPLVTWIATPQYMTVGTKALGYPDYFAYTLMVAKILGVIAIVLPQTPNTIKEWAYAGFTFNLLFAFISHYIIDKEIGNMIMPLVVLVILFVSYVYSKKIKSKN